MAIFGLGSIGATVADMLVRAGVKKLVLVDQGKVTMSNTGRLFYRAEMCGMSKVQAGSIYWSNLNSDVAMETFHCDVTDK